MRVLSVNGDRLMTKKEKLELEKAKEIMCDRYCKVPSEANLVSDDFNDWLDAIEIACEECPLDKIRR